MIVLNNRDSSESKETLEDLFKKELDAYCAYNKWLEATEDSTLELALEEIMLDEFLHAKFLRDYLIDNHMYNLTDDDPHEKRFWKIKMDMFKR